jgi:hypothetical protein
LSGATLSQPALTASSTHDSDDRNSGDWLASFVQGEHASRAANCVEGQGSCGHARLEMGVADRHASAEGLRVLQCDEVPKDRSGNQRIQGRHEFARFRTGHRRYAPGGCEAEGGLTRLP